MSQRYRKASFTLLFTGAALSLGSGFVVVAPSLARVITAAHPMHDAAAWGKPSVTRDDPARVLALLEAIDALPATHRRRRHGSRSRASSTARSWGRKARMMRREPNFERWLPSE